MYGSVAEGGGRGAVSRLRLEGRVCSMLTVMLGGDLDVTTQGLQLGSEPQTHQCAQLSDCDSS